MIDNLYNLKTAKHNERLQKHKALMDEAKNYNQKLIETRRNGDEVNLYF